MDPDPQQECVFEWPLAPNASRVTPDCIGHHEKPIDKVCREDTMRPAVCNGRSSKKSWCNGAVLMAEMHTGRFDMEYCFLTTEYALLSEMDMDDVRYGQLLVLCL